MVQTVIRSKKILILVGAALVLLLAVACSSDSNGDAGSGTGGGVSASDLSNLLAAAGGPEAAARLFQSSSSVNTGIWVNGTGKASGEPDLGIISLGVESLADTASEARGLAAVAIEKTISVLKSNNIEDRDMQTSQFSISPRYNTHEVTKCTESAINVDPSTGRVLVVPAPVLPTQTPEGLAAQEIQGSECRVEFERVLIGYQVTNTLTVKVRNLDNIGAIIDGATEAAGDLIRINRVSFTIDPTPRTDGRYRFRRSRSSVSKRFW